MDGIDESCVMREQRGSFCAKIAFKSDFFVCVCIYRHARTYVLIVVVFCCKPLCFRCKPLCFLLPSK